MIKIDESSIKTLEGLLGKTISQEEGSCLDYLGVHDLHIEELRELVRKDATLYAIKYVIFLLGEKGRLGSAMTFVDYVVKGGENIEVWMKDYYSSRLSS